ncbi:unnamed protein product [Adineta steineri]|uniref:Uncharacterized protein n=1 Tax=Adineta steineri TaxID=433720 RepID=A0A819CWZ8_9BILA|nr:unnamed protein product [Adineta steineri]
MSGLGDYKLYSLDIIGSKSLEQVIKFSQTMWKCTCHSERLLVSSGYEGAIIEEYNMNNFKLIQTYKTPISCQENQEIVSIQFNTDGTCLGVLLRYGRKDEYYGVPLEYDYYTFELRNSSSQMNLLSCYTDLPNMNYDLLPFADGQFMVYAFMDNKFLLFDCNGKLKETIHCDGTNIVSMTLSIKKNSLMILTRLPDELHFYDI